MSTKVHTDREQGFSTIEVLISFLILSIVLVGTIELISTSARLVTRTSATESSREILDRIRWDIIPVIVADISSGGDGRVLNSKEWEVTVTPIEPNQEATAISSTYGRLFHIRIAPSSTSNTAKSKSNAQVFETFRLVSRFNSGS